MWRDIQVTFVNGDVVDFEPATIRRSDGQWVTVEYMDGLTCHWPTKNIRSIHERGLDN